MPGMRRGWEEVFKEDPRLPGLSPKEVPSPDIWNTQDRAGMGGKGQIRLRTCWVWSTSRVILEELSSGLSDFKSEALVRSLCWRYRIRWQSPEEGQHLQDDQGAQELASCCLVAKLCLTPGEPMDCSLLGFPILHCFPEFFQTSVCWVGDAIQPSHPLLAPSPPALSLSQHQRSQHRRLEKSTHSGRRKTGEHKVIDIREERIQKSELSAISDASKRSSNLRAKKVQLDLVTRKVCGYLGERRFSGGGLGAEVGGQGLRWGSRNWGSGRGISVKSLTVKKGRGRDERRLE